MRYIKPRHITLENCFEIISINEKGCWIINLPVNKDGRMGAYRFEGRKIRPVKIYWKIVKGEFPNGELWRKCENITCVNPEHYTQFTSAKDRLFSKISFDGKTGCWNWVGSIDTGGYSHMRIGDKLVRPHRFIYEYYIGKIPDGYDVLHRCDNRKCCNPAHLFTGTDVENALDRDMKGRGAGNKLSQEDVREIRFLRNNGISTREIMSRFGVTKQTVYKIINHQSWRWIS